MKSIAITITALSLGVIYGVFAVKISTAADGSVSWSGLLLSFAIILVAAISFIARYLGAGSRFFLQGLVLAAISALVGWQFTDSAHIAGLFGIGGFAANVLIAKIDFDK